MCINGSGFTECRLYFFPDFFENLPTKRLLGEGVLPELVIEIDGKKIKKVLNLDEETIKVLKLMGEKYEKYYV